MFKPPRAKSLEWNTVPSLWGMLSSRPLTVALGYICLHPHRQSEANRFPVELSHSRTHKDCWLKLEDRSHSARNDRLASLQKGNVPVIIQALAPPVCSLQQLRPRGDLALPHLSSIARVLPMLGTSGHITDILMSPVVFPHPHYEYFCDMDFPHSFPSSLRVPPSKWEHPVVGGRFRFMVSGSLCTQWSVFFLFLSTWS